MPATTAQNGTSRTPVNSSNALRSWPLMSSKPSRMIAEFSLISSSSLAGRPSSLATSSFRSFHWFNGARSRSAATKTTWPNPRVARTIIGRSACHASTVPSMSVSLGAIMLRRPSPPADTGAGVLRVRFQRAGVPSSGTIFSNLPGANRASGASGWSISLPCEPTNRTRRPPIRTHWSRASSRALEPASSLWNISGRLVEITTASTPS